METARIGINGFGRIGRLALRAGWERPELEFAWVNEIKGDSETAAHLLTFDSVHGRWAHEVAGGAGLSIDGAELGFSSSPTPGEPEWEGIDVVLERSGKFKTAESLGASGRSARSSRSG